MHCLFMWTKLIDSKEGRIALSQDFQSVLTDNSFLAHVTSAFTQSKFHREVPPHSDHLQCGVMNIQKYCRVSLFKKRTSNPPLSRSFNISQRDISQNTSSACTKEPPQILKISPMYYTYTERERDKCFLQLISVQDEKHKQKENKLKKYRTCNIYCLRYNEIILK